MSVCVCICMYEGFYINYINLYLTDIAITYYWYPLQVRPWRIIYNTIQCIIFECSRAYVYLHVCLCSVVCYKLHIYVKYFFLPCLHASYSAALILSAVSLQVPTICQCDLREIWVCWFQSLGAGAYAFGLCFVSW